MAFAPNEHRYDEEDGFHDEGECELCLEINGTTTCDCRCGRCCATLIIEATLRDAEREPRIKDLPTIKGFTDELEGYLLNGPDGPCVFLDRNTMLCTIYETRPLVCRLFDCPVDWPAYETDAQSERDRGHKSS